MCLSKMLKHSRKKISLAFFQGLKTICALVFELTKPDYVKKIIIIMENSLNFFFEKWKKPSPFSNLKSIFFVTKNLGNNI